MKRLFFTLLVLTTVANAQNQLNGASVSIYLDRNNFQVKQAFEVNLEDTLKSFELKSLKFEDSEINNISIKSTGNVEYEKLLTEGLDHLKLIIEERKSSEYILKYEVIRKEASLNIPLFFPELTASSSENNFFKTSIELPENQAYYLHFPAVQVVEEIKKGRKIISFELPAITSVIRLELLNDVSEASNFINYVDGSVAMLFVVIAYLIWRNRKQLIYG